MKRILVPLLIAALLCLCLAASAAGNTPLSFDAGVNTVNEGATLQTVLNREGEAAEGDVTYTSSDPKVAQVDEDGLVTAVKKGKVTITASVKAEKKTYKATLKLTVIRPVTSLTVKTDKLPVYEPTDETVAPYLKERENAGENELPVLLLSAKKKLQLTVTAEPKDASDRTVTLTGNDDGVFTAKQTTITGVAPGEAILTISSNSTPDVSVSYRVLVVQPVTKLTVSASGPNVVVGGEATVSAAVQPENATVQKVTWSSANEKILTVDADGTVHGIKRGSGRITATAADGSNIRTNFTLKVVQNPESVSLNVPEITIDVGRNQAVKATILPKDTDNKKVTWTSSDESVATVDKTGRIKAVAVGDCTVTCACEALPEITASVTVHAQQPVKKIAFNAKSAIVYLGENAKLNWNVEPADATNPTLKFTSSNTKIVTVDENGEMTGVASGKATITATSTDGSKRSAKISVQVGEHVRGVSMLRRHAYIDAGESARASAQIQPKNALNKNMFWTSSNEGVVTVKGDKDGHAHLKGVRHGEAVVTGVTEDGGFETSIPVTVGDFDKGLKFINFDFDRKGQHFWLTVRNESDVTVTQITAKLRMFDAMEEDLPAVPINTKNGSNEVSIVWNGTLRPGQKTGKDHWKMVDYKAPANFDGTRGTVTLYCYTINNDWIKTIREGRRPWLEY